jgi:ribosomal protein S18 acetylase RimI-like enzyme
MRERERSRVLIREVLPDEHARVGDLTVETYRAIPGPAHVDDSYEAEIRDVAGRLESAAVLVAVDDGGNVVGAVTYVPDEESAWAERLLAREAGLRLLAVDMTAQGRGVGQELLRSVIARAHADDRVALVLHTTAWMEVAGAMYRRAGFVRAPERDFAADGLDLLAYRLELR